MTQRALRFRIVVGAVVGLGTVSLLSQLATNAAVQPAVSAANSESPRAELRRLAAGGQRGLSASQTAALVEATVRNTSVSQDLMGPVAVPSDALASIASLLTEQQRLWQASPSEGLQEPLLAKRLNQVLRLADEPEYLTIRVSDIREARGELWRALPELSTGGRLDKPEPGRMFGAVMSPLEGFAVADIVLHWKLYNPDFTTPVAAADRGRRSGWASRRPGLYEFVPNDRQRQFQQRLDNAIRQWSTPDDVVNAVRSVLGGPHDEK